MKGHLRLKTYAKIHCEENSKAEKYRSRFPPRLRYPRDAASRFAAGFQTVAESPYGAISPTDYLNSERKVRIVSFGGEKILGVSGKKEACSSFVTRLEERRKATPSRSCNKTTVIY